MKGLWLVDFLMSYALCIMDRFICVACSNIPNTLQYICVTGTNMATRCLHRVRTYIMDQLRARSICWIHTGSDMRHMMLCNQSKKQDSASYQFCFLIGCRTSYNAQIQCEFSNLPYLMMRLEHITHARIMVEMYCIKKSISFILYKNAFNKCVFDINIYKNIWYNMI